MTFERLLKVPSDISQDSLPTDNIGGEITYHRYYHVFREGELDQLIEKYVENLHIISSYYDHASWCIIAEKVQVWTIWPVQKAQCKYYIYYYLLSKKYR